MAHADLIRRYENGVNKIENAVQGLSRDVLDREPQPGKWSIRQLIAHIADAELMAATRMRFVAAEPGAPLKAFDQDKWAAGLGYAHIPTEQALALIRALRTETATMLRGLPESAWNHTGRHEERGELSVARLLEETINHGEHHAEHIDKLKKQFTQAA
jgi:uncharacterized damage-inducible protein DinB